ncbi:substrate-binding domain-containing protein [Streptomyces ochraceiscleroticus]|uniref:Substrate-binding domain-containing protein n=1 Tax=Streptomyces ochraceiscleroticus TaxID=47761 RepID=A0ABW1MR47_9ACTN|nr:substrate-binding domain-containing protein [Streptomyces ochraceiscleroticus]
MTSYRCGAAVVAGAACLALGLGACGQPGESSGSGPGKGGLRIGLLLVENQTARYEGYDRPLIEKKIKELCHTCTMEYANAHDDAAIQRQQLDSMITKGVDVLILDAVDVQGIRSSVTEAKRAGVPVVAYDRDAQGPISAYVTHDVETIGTLQGEALLKAMAAKRHGGLVIRLEGPSKSSRLRSPYTQGTKSVLEGKVKTSRMYRAAEWDGGSAQIAMSAAIAAEGVDHVNGVWTGNDVLAGGAIAALKQAHITPLPPVVGQDAELAAVQRLVSGEQYMTVYKPYKPEADAAARIAVALGRGERIDHIAEDKVDTPTTEDVPAALLPSIPMTRANIKDTVVKDGVYTIDQICIPKYRAACDRAGLTG